jgi:hypothetical protein
MNSVIAAPASTDLSKATTGLAFESVHQQDRPLVELMDKVAKVVQAIAKERGVDTAAAATMVQIAESMHPGFVQAKSAVLEQYQAYRNEHPVPSYKSSRGK